METHDTDSPIHDRRPLGFWLRAVDGLISREFAAAFDDEPIDRRDWMILNALDGSVDEPLAERLRERLARRPKRLVRLAELGWISASDGRWTLTDEGRAAKERLAAEVDAVRERVAGAVPAEDFVTTRRTLEAIARELGGDDDDALRFGVRGRRHGFAHRVHARAHGECEHGEHGRGRRGFGPHGFEPGHHRFGPHAHRAC
ncbi:hypothetical protein [Microbacterium rhizophilus]|uniref:hypothetical protein n=1 Tax=Microbacterium rhizophilus TaxID=3138934 RepID=UPI0031F169CE